MEGIEEKVISTNNQKIRYTELITKLINWNRGMDLYRLMNEDNYLEESYFYKEINIQEFLHELNDAFTLIEQEESIDKAEEFIPKFVEFLVNRFAESDPVVTPDVIHSALAYKEGTKFYESVLLYLTDKNYLLESNIDTDLERKYLTVFQIKLASINRAKGNLSIAMKLLKRCQERLEVLSINDESYLVEFSKLKYDLAFIHVIQGDGVKANQEFEKSIRYSQTANKLVGAWISKCAQKKWGYLYEVNSLEEFENTILQACHEFKELSQKDSNAERWVYNCYLNLFRVSYYKSDSKSSKKYFSLIEKDKWAEKFNIKNSPQFITMQPRIHYLEGKTLDAISGYAFIPQNKEELNMRFKELQQGKA